MRPDPASPSRSRRVAGRLGLVAAGVAAVVAWMLGPDWLRLAWSQFPDASRRRAALLYLDALLIGYTVAVIGSIGLIGGVLLLRCRRRPDDAGRRRRHARLLATAASAMLASLALDVGAAAWSGWQGRIPRLPGGRTGSEGRTADGPDARAADSAEPVLPVRFSAVGAGSGPGSGPLRLLVIGESSGRGEPYHPWLSVGQIAAWKMQAIFPGRPIEVEIWATGGASLKEMHLRLAALSYRPDALILYAGHNEFQARYSWNREVEHYLAERPSLHSIERLTALLRHSPFCRLVLDTREHQQVDLRPPRRVTRDLVDRPVCTPAEYDAILDEFRGRVEAIAAYCDAIGTLPIFIVAASNDGGFDPTRSVLAADTPEAERVAFARAVERARALERRDPDAALRVLDELVARHPEFAETHFRLARLLERRGEWAEARRHYIAARECDGLPLRCPEAFRRVIRDAAARHPAIVLVDGPKVLEAAAGHGILDDRLFHDAQHPNLRGYAALAQDLLDRLRARRAFGWPEGAEAPPVEANACARHFGMDAGRWATACRREAHFYLMTAYVRYDPKFRNERYAAYLRAAEKIEAGADPALAGIPGWSMQPIPSSMPRLIPAGPEPD